MDDAVDNDTFFVCPQTTLVPEEYGYKNNTYSDIWVKQDNISILCARDGDNRNSSDYCVFEGGISHVYIRGDNAYFEGFLFEGATDGSVRAWGEQTANYVTFVDCVWRDNRGDVGSAISIWHTYEELGVAQNVKLVRCSFEENTSLYAGSAVLNEGGTLVVKDSIFIENKGVSYVSTAFLHFLLSIHCENNVCDLPHQEPQVNQIQSNSVLFVVQYIYVPIGLAYRGITWGETVHQLILL